MIWRAEYSAASEGFGLALLFSEIDPRYYEHLGFRQLPINQVVLSVRPGTRPGPPAIPMRSGDFGDIPSIVEMNASGSAGYRLALARDPDYARHAIIKKRLLAACGAPGHRKVEFFVVEEGGRAAAYVVLLEVGSFAMITECGDRDPTGARVGAMMQALLARDPARIDRRWKNPRRHHPRPNAGRLPVARDQRALPPPALPPQVSLHNRRKRHYLANRTSAAG